VPGTLQAVVMVVLHRGWNRPTQLRAVLAYNSALPIIIAAHGERLEVGNVYIGEPSEHPTLAARGEDPKRRYGGRTVDVLFASVAAHAGARATGVVLAGSLDDGSRGLAAIHHAGGMTIVVTPAPAPEKGVPENAIQYDGPIDLIGDPWRIAQAISATCEQETPASLERVKLVISV
jgi:two-component system chemotaxis response regulator CheB